MKNNAIHGKHETAASFWQTMVAKKPGPGLGLTLGSISPSVVDVLQHNFRRI